MSRFRRASVWYSAYQGQDRGVGGMLRRWLVVALLVVSCGGQVAATTVTDTTVVDPGGFGVLSAIAVNEIGFAEFSEEMWVAVAADACARQAWQHGEARLLASELIADRGLESKVDEAGLARVIWMVVVNSCRELVPDGVLQGGPP